MVVNRHLVGYVNYNNQSNESNPSTSSIHSNNVICVPVDHHLSRESIVKNARTRQVVQRTKSVCAAASQRKQRWFTQWCRLARPNNWLCGDYSQTLTLPNFGGEQPGNKYYCSPLSVSCFGLDICCCFCWCCCWSCKFSGRADKKILLVVLV